MMTEDEEREAYAADQRHDAMRDRDLLDELRDAPTHQSRVAPGEEQ
jgi:hypothetical protein